MSKVMGKVEKILNVVLIIVYFIILFATFLQVFYRYVLNSPLMWSEELLRYVFIWGTFIAAGIELGKGTHVRIDALVSVFNKKVQKIIEIISNSIIIIFLIYMVFIGIELVSKVFFTTSSALKIPFGLVYLALPVGSIIGIIFLINALSHIKKFDKSNK